MTYSPKGLGAILSTVNLDGFTYCLHGSLKRYVVAFTHNAERTTELLAKQANHYSSIFGTLTIGGWTDDKGDVYIDVGTSVSSFDDAISLAKGFDQQAIYDLVEEVNIDLLR